MVNVTAAQRHWGKLVEDRVREVSRGQVIPSLTGRGENWGFTPNAVGLC